ncbi:MAG: hypothetical protein JWP97_2703 [Labilithrix sp.]|nr:hypothetical protein [Labilithrix sp.]
MTRLLASVPALLVVLAASAPAAAQQQVTAPAPAAPAAPAEVRLDLVSGEVKLLSMDDAKGFTVEPETGLVARVVDDGHTLRLVTQSDGTFTVRVQKNDGTTAVYSVHVGTEAAGTKAVATAAGAPGAPAPDKRSADEHYTSNTIDLNLEGGAGRHFGDPAETLGFGRARVGVMFARWPVFTMIGATYEYNNLSPATFGLQGELLHLSGGVWAQAGGMMDIHGKAGVMGALGISIVGVEVQYRGFERDDGGLSTGVAVLGKLRVPLGVILYALDQNKKKTKP